MRDHRDIENKNQEFDGNIGELQGDDLGCLVFSFRQNEVIRIGNDIQITVKRIDKHQARMAIIAPKAKKIKRIGLFDEVTQTVLLRGDMGND